MEMEMETETAEEAVRRLVTACLPRTLTYNKFVADPMTINTRDV